MEKKPLEEERGFINIKTFWWSNRPRRSSTVSLSLFCPPFHKKSTNTPQSISWLPILLPSPFLMTSKKKHKPPVINNACFRICPSRSKPPPKFHGHTPRYFPPLLHSSPLLLPGPGGGYMAPSWHSNFILYVLFSPYGVLYALFLSSCPFIRLLTPFWRTFKTTVRSLTHLISLLKSQWLDFFPRRFPSGMGRDKGPDFIILDR